MADIHCHSCGGFITDPRRIAPTAQRPHGAAHQQLLDVYAANRLGPPVGVLVVAWFPTMLRERLAWSTGRSIGALIEGAIHCSG